MKKNNFAFFYPCKFGWAFSVVSPHVYDDSLWIAVCFKTLFSHFAQHFCAFAMEVNSKKRTRPFFIHRNYGGCLRLLDNMPTPSSQDICATTYVYELLFQHSVRILHRVFLLHLPEKKKKKKKQKRILPFLPYLR